MPEHPDSLSQGARARYYVGNLVLRGLIGTTMNDRLQEPFD